MSIEKKIDKMQEDVTDIKVHMAQYNEQLKIHIKRSDLLEKKMEPLEKHVSMAQGAVKFIGLIAMIAGILEALHFMLE